MTWKSMIEHFRVPNSVRPLLVEQLLSAAIYNYNIFNTGRTYSITQATRGSVRTTSIPALEGKGPYNRVWASIISTSSFP
jgi:hypothetical protein